MNAASGGFRLRWPHYLLAAATYGALLLAWAPASLATRWVSAEAAPAARLQQAEGSLWNGRAQLTVDLGAPRAVGTLSWRWRPFDLLTGRLGLEARLEGAQVAATSVVRLGAGRLALSGLDARAAVPWLAGFDAALAAWPFGGVLHLTSDALDLQAGAIEGGARVDWLDAAYGQRTLGRHRLEASGDGAAMKLRLTTLDGPLHLDGTGEWRPPRGLSFAGSARARPGAGDLADLLKLLGPDQGGAHAFRFPQ